MGKSEIRDQRSEVGPGNMERRYFGGDVETRLRMETDGDDQPMLLGYAAVFDVLSEPLWDGFREQIAPGFFGPVLDDDVRALWNHDSNYVLGRTEAGTLRLAEDDKGLRVEIMPPDAQWARDVMVSMERGDVTQMSFGFYVAEDRWEEVDGELVRTLVRAEELFDVSPVTYPAYPQTTVQVREHAAELRARLAVDDGAGDAERRALPGLLRKRLELIEVGQTGGLR